MPCLRGAALLGLVVLVVDSGVGARHADGHEFTVLPDYTPNLGVSMSDLSADGSVIVGATQLGTGLAIRWTKAEGYRELGDLRDPPTLSDADAVTADGRIVVGGGTNEGIDMEGYYWTDDGGMVSIGTLAAPVPGEVHAIESSGVSDAGDVVVGYVGRNGGNGFEAFRWTASQGMEALGALPGGFDSAALDITGDGTKLVGSAYDECGQQAVYWTRASGFVALGNFSGVSSSSAAEAITPDGAVIVGQASTEAAFEAFRWSSETGLVSLGLLPGGTWSRGLGVTADGTSVIGIANGPGSLSARIGFIWDEARGMRDLTQVLINDYGLRELTNLNALGLPGLQPRAISDDGLTIIGPNWIADLHGDFLPGDANFDGAVDLADFGTLKANFGTGQYRNQGDFSADGRVDLTDFGLLKQNFGATTAVPEPSAWILAVLAAAATCGLRRRAPSP